ncbi:MAG: methylated-DNA--[protein]-cysteine S-methyltransferase [Hyphomicrobiales bacterium]|nr:methylated-DNA--[protein]-cysteine S-methyltransferase [Hyphomicrobiales bacterium]
MSATSSTGTTAGPGRFFSLVDTALGVIALEWSHTGLTKLRLPEADAEAMAERLARDASRVADKARPQFVAAAVSDLENYADGSPVDFGHLPLDLSGCSPFEQAVYRHALGIAYGKTTTYGDIARALGDIGHSRAVGQALGRNPLAIIVPCHRVLAAGGKSGGFSAFGGRVTKARLLQLEGASLPGDEPTLPGLDLPIVMREAPRSSR